MTGVLPSYLLMFLTTMKNKQTNGSMWVRTAAMADCVALGEHALCQTRPALELRPVHRASCGHRARWRRAEALLGSPPSQRGRRVFFRRLFSLLQPSRLPHRRRPAAAFSARRSSQGVSASSQKAFNTSAEAPPATVTSEIFGAVDHRRVARSATWGGGGGAL